MHIVKNYDSPSEFLASLAGKEQFHPYQSSWASPESAWHGVSFESAVDLVEKGWPDSPRLAAPAAELTQAARKVSTRYDVAGSFVDMGRFTSGIPECMGRFTRKRSPKVWTIGAQLGANWTVSNDRLALRGAMVLALVDWIESSGDRVELYVATRGKSVGLVMAPEVELLESIKLKSAGESLDVDSLAFWTCHGSAFRRLIFRHQEEVFRAEFPAFYQDGYGTHLDLWKGDGFNICGKAFDFIIRETPKDLPDTVAKFEELVEELRQSREAGKL